MAKPDTFITFCLIVLHLQRHADNADFQTRILTDFLIRVTKYQRYPRSFLIENYFKYNELIRDGDLEDYFERLK